MGLGAIALATAGVLALAGCAPGAESAGPVSATAIITTNGTEPANPLIPTNTNEVGGGKITDNIFAGLVYYDAKGAPVNDVAESMKTTDSQNYTIKIKPKLTFTNGEAVTANSFVDAWNYGALLSNKQLNSYFFEDIKGFSYDEDSALSGLAVVDDTTFTVALKSKLADFPLRLGYTAFMPLPAAAFTDMAAFGEAPIGNGPYKIGAGGWQHNVKIDLVVNEGYTGGRLPKNGGLTINFYSDLAAAYADLQGGNLDVNGNIPDSAFATYEDDLDGRTVNQPAAIFQSFTIPARLAHFAGEEGKLRRQAISQAINRAQITKVIFADTRTPAKDFTSPVIDGYSGKIPGSKVLEYNPKNAKKLWAEANAIAPWTGKFELAYNADGGHQGWVDAAMNSLKNVLGIDAIGSPQPTFAGIRTAVTNRSIQTAFRSGWQADYPGLFNFLGPLYGTGAGSNDGDYSDPAFDALLKKGSSADTAAAANKEFQAAQEILLSDLPAIPLWYSNVVGGYGPKVGNVTFGWNQVPLYYAMTKTE